MTKEEYRAMLNKMQPKNLTCCICGQRTKGLQWYNRDTGYGICTNCADWIKNGKRETPEEMLKNYGIEGTHYSVIKESEV